MRAATGGRGGAGPIIRSGGPLDSLDAAWEKFVSGESGETLAARSPIIASWERCRASQVDLSTTFAPQMERDAIEALRYQNRELLAAAAETLADAADTLAGTDSLMLITDANGVVLEGAGDGAAMHAAADIALSKGGIWREVAAGTNGIGTTLATGRAMAVYAGEHYCERMKQWSCAAAPITDPVDGSVIGALNLSVCKASATAHIFALALMGAKQVEQWLTRRSEEVHARLLAFALDQAHRHRGDGLIALDAKGRVVYASRAARRRLSERLRTDVPVLGKGRRLFDDPAGGIGGPLSDIPAEWIKPAKFDGELCGHVMVIPSAEPVRTIAMPRVASDDGKAGVAGFNAIVGRSPRLQTTIARACQVAALDVPLLIEGETGTGKELFARAVHDSGRDATGPFVTFNCGAVSRELIASELFGYARGAFTGASPTGRAGRFEAASGGTLCLDEVGELPLDLQPYLLRVLEDGQICRVGDNRMQPVNVRVISMTNRNLRGDVEAGRFRRDLFHRLAVLSIALPPLRDRDRDVERLIDHFTPLVAARHGRDPVAFTPQARAMLSAYSWPGNVRELRNVIERATLFAVDGVADLSCLPEDVLQAHAMAPRDEEEDVGRIRDAIARSAGNISYACALLGMSRSTLYRRMERYGLSPKTLRPSIPRVPRG